MESEALKILKAHKSSVETRMLPLLSDEARMAAELALLRVKIAEVRREIAQISLGIEAMAKSATTEQLSSLVRESAHMLVHQRAEDGVILSIAAKGQDATRNAIVHHARIKNPDHQRMTIKQLSMKALTNHFENGATANELLELFQLHWGREDITRTSLSPQLSRLKDEGKIKLDGKLWKIAEQKE